ncbi:DNA mismatch repair protein MutS [Anaeromyxobacter diazotrophicus]|uniref:DNA mismatch repair protein MutS n=1 Tax=Anaeromyxobacter diazotrophicus TaxID=2590199 RepID=A0A7I9VM23_9BACT|nr:DNA mismatch repair protein MutS [Anaeromyxobacter diazotrophicus]GEJ57456.1 DNA mismatch repair protein MutS [Anaeromyxobacter diazotrophicus]
MPPEIAQAATPMMRQYLETKARYPDALLFFRLGDFYELFFDDAVQASEALQITLTARSKGEDKVPMCGVPHHAARGYVAKLLERGFKVAICDQVEEPGKSALVKREVTRVVTPGMVLDDQVLDPREAAYVGAVALAEGGGGGLALLDASTGELKLGEVASDARLADELRRAGVRELLLARDAAAGARGAALAAAVGAPLAEREPADFARAGERLRRHLGVAGLDGFGVGDLALGQAAAAAALAYLEDTQCAAPAHVDRLSRLATDEALLLDEATRQNLELERTLAGGKRKGSLLGVLDRSVTALGGRRLAEWLRWPLLDPAAIGARLDAVEELVGGALLREDLAEALRPVADLERLLSRLALRQGNARDLRALATALVALPRLADLLEGADAGRPRAALLAACGAGLRGLEALAALLDRAVAEEPPPTLKEGGLIRRGHSEELDRLVALVEDGKGYIARLEAAERARTGIGSLKVRYNRVFGYYLEVTKPNLHLVPPDYERRQTTVGGERFVTPALKEYEEQVLGAEERRAALEERLFEALRARVVEEGRRLRTAAGAVATADALLALARVAAERGYVRPEVDRSERLDIEDGRHPVVEAMLPADSGGFVPNGVLTASSGEGEDAPQLLVITGPNMAGKSTVLRQTALIALLAQMGSFVPARRARVGLVDRIFTRVGASDDLARGRSTFMVEMTETAAILHNATRRSLVVLDEIGRGTSTFDGVSIAWAVAEHLHDRTGCRTLFATHYHELQDLARERPRVRNLTVAVREVGEQVVFLRRLVEGGASRSYGIEVAKLAGLPAEVLARAREILKNLESMEVDERGRAALARGRRPAPSPPGQLALFAGSDPALAALKDELLALDLDGLRPLEALNLLAGWKQRLA